jgi:hypothetical protein
MQLEFEAKKLVDYINSLGLNIPPRKASHEHVGAIIADAVLQGGGHRYKIQVEPRVERVRNRYPAAGTVSGLSSLLKSQGPQALLNWSGEDEQQRFRQTVAFFVKEHVNTFDDLRRWLRSEANRDRLITRSDRVDKAGIAEISDATADYYRVLVRLPDAVKVDSRVEQFLTDAGISVRGYKYAEKRTIVQLAAKELGVRPIDLDGAIWAYQEERRLKGGKSMNKGTGATRYERLTQHELNQRVDVIRNRGVRDLCHECLDLLKRHRCWPVHCGDDNISVHDYNVLNDDKEELLIRFVPRKTKDFFTVRVKPPRKARTYIRKDVHKMSDFTNVVNCLQTSGRITWWRGSRCFVPARSQRV